MTQEQQPPEITDTTTEPVSGAPTQPATEASPRRRLERSRTERMVAGVCGGLAEHFDVDPVLVRVAFVVLTLFTSGLFALVYGVMWFAVPEEDGAPVSREGAALAKRGGEGGGAIVFGVLLVAGGTFWLLSRLGVFDRLGIDWRAAMASALIAIGALLVVSGGRLARRGLIPVGIVLAVVLAMGTSAGMHMDFRSGFSERTERPASMTELRDDYSHAFGSLTVDLSRLELPSGTTSVEANTAFGSLMVRVPPGVGVRVQASTAFGSIDALGDEVSGIAGERTVTTAGYDRAERRLDLKVSSAFGSVEVTR